MMRGQVIAIPGLTNKALATAARLIPRELIPGMVRIINEPSHDS